MRKIVVTGVSSGIGNGLTRELLKNGYFVYGSVRKKEDAERLKQEFGQNFYPLVFDVTDFETIKKAALEVKVHLKNENLYALVNNAGTSRSSPLMHVPIETFRQNLEVLVVGQLAVTQAFLPLLGASKNFDTQPGKIINISSIYGKLRVPFMGNYITSKHALEGMTATLRHELKLYNIKVVAVGPGTILTPIWDKNPDSVFDAYKDTDFHAPYLRFSKLAHKVIDNESFTLEEFSRKLFRIIHKKRNRLRYAIVKKKFKNWYLPLWVGDRFTMNTLAKKIY